MKRAFFIACLTSVVLAVGAFADTSTNAPPPPPPPPHRPRPMMDNILGPRILETLALTSDQQTKYNALNDEFKKAVAKLNATTGTNAVAGPDRKQFRELHRSYIEKVRPILTADQNAKLTQWLESGPGHGRHGGGPDSGGNPPTPPPGDN